jgi:dienelactone hydrolase
MLRKIRKRLLPLGLLILALLSLSVSMQLELPSSGGPYPVGRTLLKGEDPSRAEDLTQDPHDAREVPALVWYPAEPGTGSQAGYFPNLAAVSNALVQSGEVQPWEVYALRWVRSENPMDARPLMDRAPYPVVILSPGNATNVEFYSSLAGEIASQGYVVVGLNHPYDVAAVELASGRVAQFNNSIWELDFQAHQAYIAERIKVRTADVLFTLDVLEQMNSNPDSSFAGMLDLNSVAVAGHSLGGITASEACKADQRFKACLNLDGLQSGGPFSTEETAIPPGQPFLFLTKESALHPKLIESFEATSESYWVVIHGASHESFADGPLLRPSLLPFSGQAERVMELTQKYTLAFLDQTLKGQPSQLLAQPGQQADVSVTAYPTH